MSRRVALALVLLVLGGAQAGAGLSLSPSSVQLAIFAPASMPLKLTAGPDGATSVGANGTSASSAVTGGVVAPSVSNTSTVASQLAGTHRIRLRVVSVTGPVSECVECSLQLRQGGVATAQVSYVDGAAVSTTGAWFTFGPGASATVHAVARARVVADQDVVVRYAVDLVPQGASSPVLALDQMRVTFRV